jgi:hypothetical protein
MDALVRVRTHTVGLAVGSVFASVGPWLHSRGQSRPLTAEGVRAERPGGTGSIKITFLARRQAPALISRVSSLINSITEASA